MSKVCINIENENYIEVTLTPYVKSLISYAATAAKLLQSCPTLCDPTDRSPPGSSIHGIFQARVLEWGAIAFSEIHLTISYNSVSAYVVNRSRIVT